MSFPLSLGIQVDRLDHETDRVYSRRCWFIANQNPKTINQYLQAEKWSFIDANITFLKCKYSEDVHDKIERMNDQVLYRESDLDFNAFH